MNKPIDALLQREMDRKEFILTLGLGILSVFGFSRIILLLSGKSFEHRLDMKHGLGIGESQLRGYGR